jgi:hypothetical protein
MVALVVMRSVIACGRCRSELIVRARNRNDTAIWGLEYHDRGIVPRLRCLWEMISSLQVGLISMLCYSNPNLLISNMFKRHPDDRQ